MLRPLLVFVCFCLLGDFAALAQQTVLTEVRKLHPKEVRVSGFRLDRQQAVTIEATGLFEKSASQDLMIAGAWILNSDNRQVVWSLSESSDSNGALREFQGTIELPRGTYEVYYATYPHFFRHSREHCEDCNDWQQESSVHRGERHGSDWSFRSFISRLSSFDWEDDLSHRYRDLYRHFTLVVRGDGESLDSAAIEKAHKQYRGRAAIAMPVRYDDRYETQAFRVKRPAELRIYAIGEASRSGTYDYGFILNTETLEKAWELTYERSEFAGGAPKNRIQDEVISLAPGNYVAIYVSDDSHSPWRWNAAPPYDPFFFGLTIFPGQNTSTNDFELTDYQGLDLSPAIIDFTRLREKEFRSQGFSLKRDMDLRILALGEGEHEEMFDYGWIIDAASHQKVWEMDYSKTRHAGGGRKNRQVDSVIRFKKGSYLAHFVTDGSHSYRDWNTSPPFLPELWGMAILPADGNLRLSDIGDFSEEEDPSLLTRIVRVRDNDVIRKAFSLGRDSKVRIYALGEGRSGEMFDYGWIEQAKTGRVVWDMSYRKTERAGGARKNRLSNEIVFLEKGDYVLYYESDDSHSFNDWNDRPPHDPANWGITVSMVDE